MPIAGLVGCALGYGGQSDIANRGGLAGTLFPSGNNFTNLLNYQYDKNRINHNYNSAGLSNGSLNQNRNKLCRNGQKCDINGCGFHHSPIQKPCRNGNSCSRKSTCLFTHEVHDPKNE